MAQNLTITEVEDAIVGGQEDALEIFAEAEAEFYLPLITFMEKMSNGQTRQAGQSALGMGQENPGAMGAGPAGYLRSANPPAPNGSTGLPLGRPAQNRQPFQAARS